ncbi:MAG: 23S rRNA (uracil(1939)-C(5))-methyltransferase RlmD [Clostridia bacterium]|nr:23S rRNA (uracil(1939)-C(5))-methyltransferase RlmD [Clostridia bacterium]
METINHSYAPCPLAKKCGGCQMQNISYEKQLNWKMKTEIGLLSSFGHVEEILPMEHPYHYRNKVQAAFGTDRKGKIISGVYQSGTHHIVPVDSCMIEDQKADEIIVTIRELRPSFKILPYNEDTGRGILRHVLVKRGFQSGEIMVVLVTSSAVFPSRNHFVEALRKKHPDITTILQNVNPGNTSLVLGENEKILYGNGFITDLLCGLKFRISSRSFYQINPIQTEKLYSNAIEFAALSGEEIVIDAYCGVGTIGLCAAKKAKSVIGIELERAAVRNAIENAKLNLIRNTRFYTGDASDFLEEMASAGEKADVVFLDPPRAGSTSRFISSVAVLAPEKVIYISCNPETLARDLREFSKHGYKANKIQPVDMFPFTHHVETVVLMTKTDDGER